MKHEETQAMFTINLNKVFKECQDCAFGDFPICNVEGCPNLGHVSEEAYAQWSKEKLLWNAALREESRRKHEEAYKQKRTETVD